MSDSEALLPVVGNETEKIENELIKKKIVWYRNKDQRVLAAMATLTLLFCVAEFGFGIIANSLALISDAFHMLSDLISLIIGFAAIQLSHRSASRRKSYGWVRAEVIGGLVNGVFLIAVCFFIILEAVQRLLDPPVIKDPILVMIVGGAGLMMNLIGLILFASHRNLGHAGHSHSHGHGHAHKEKKHKHKKEEKHKHEEEGDVLLSEEANKKETKHKNENKDKHKHKHNHEEEEGGSANLHAVFLHVLGDALGSVGAVGSGLVIHFVQHPWKYYADPTFSLILACIILRSAIPLVKQCANILLQSVPETIEMDALNAALLKVEGIINIHELHVWQLSNAKYIATLHAAVDKTADFSSIASTIKSIFHNYGIHSTTIQPEYVSGSLPNTKVVCKMTCEPEGSAKLCCQPVSLVTKNGHYGTLK